jgi:hypothetical protein
LNFGIQVLQLSAFQLFNECTEDCDLKTSNPCLTVFHLWLKSFLASRLNDAVN